MNPTQWQRLQDIVNSAADLPVSERDVYLQRCCHGDLGLRGRVDDLLSAYSHAGDFFETRSGALPRGSRNGRISRREIRSDHTGSLTSLVTVEWAPSTAHSGPTSSFVRALPLSLYGPGRE